MGHALAQVRLARTSGLPEDVVVNTFHFLTASDPVDGTDAALITTRIENFYKVAGDATVNAVQTYLSNVLATSGHEIRVYDMGLPEPRTPIRTLAMSLTPGSAALPSEVALCVSYRRPLISGVDPARRRGRIFVGPLSTAAAGATSAGDVRPIAAFQNSLAFAAQDLATPTTGSPAWSVYSAPAAAYTGKDGQPIPANPGDLDAIVTVWVDNAFDTQRRRGAAPTSRVTLTVP